MQGTRLCPTHLILLPNSHTQVHGISNARDSALSNILKQKTTDNDVKRSAPLTLLCRYTFSIPSLYLLYACSLYATYTLSLTLYVLSRRALCVLSLLSRCIRYLYPLYIHALDTCSVIALTLSLRSPYTRCLHGSTPSQRVYGSLHVMACHCRVRGHLLEPETDSLHHLALHHSFN